MKTLSLDRSGSNEGIPLPDGLAATYVYMDPGEIVAVGGPSTFAFNVTAPSTPRTYAFCWSLRDLEGNGTFHLVAVGVAWFISYFNCLRGSNAAPIPVPTGDSSSDYEKKGAV